MIWGFYRFLLAYSKENPVRFFFYFRISVGFLDGLGQKTTAKMFCNFHQQYSIFLCNFVFHRRTIHTVYLTKFVHKSTNTTAYRGIGVECAATALLRQPMHAQNGSYGTLEMRTLPNSNTYYVHTVFAGTRRPKNGLVHRI